MPAKTIGRDGMRHMNASAEIGYRVDDGDIGYVGDTHLSFTHKLVESVASVRSTPAGDAALAGVYRILRARVGAHGAEQSTTPRRSGVTQEGYRAAIGRVVRG